MPSAGSSRHGETRCVNDPHASPAPGLKAYASGQASTGRHAAWSRGCGGGGRREA